MQINARRKYTLPNFQTATSNISNTFNTRNSLHKGSVWEM